MKPRTEHASRRAKLPPILEIDDDGGSIDEIRSLAHPRWSSDSDEPGVALDEWPGEYDD